MNGIFYDQQTATRYDLTFLMPEWYDDGSGPNSPNIKLGLIRELPGRKFLLVIGGDTTPSVSSETDIQYFYGYSSLEDLVTDTDRVLITKRAFDPDTPIYILGSTGPTAFTRFWSAYHKTSEISQTS